jgi:soluble lytic murein transglycosylase
MARKSARFKQWGRWLLAIIFASGLWAFYDHWRTSREISQDEVILAAAERYGMDAALIKAVVWRESWFDPLATGKAGEIGLMQVGDLAAHEWADVEQIRSFTLNQLFDPAKNTLAGTWYLRKALRRYGHTDDPIPYALADYNAGRANVLKWVSGAATTNSGAFTEQIGFPSTKEYVQSVMQRYAFYRQIFPPPARQASSPATGWQPP